MATDLDAWLSGARPPEERVPILLDASLAAEHAEAEEALRALVDDRARAREEGRSGSGRFVDTEVDEARARVRDVEARVDAASRTFVVRSVGIDERMALRYRHPAQENDMLDRIYGYARIPYLLDLVRACLVEPAMTDAQWERFRSVVAPGQMDRLMMAADRVTDDVDGSVPRSRLASVETDGSGETSALPSENSASARAASGGGSRASSRRTSGTRRGG